MPTLVSLRGLIGLEISISRDRYRELDFGFPVALASPLMLARRRPPAWAIISDVPPRLPTIVRRYKIKKYHGR